MRVLRGFLTLKLVGATLAIATGFFAFLHPAFDTASNFRLHMAVGLLVIVVLLLATKAYRRALAGAIVAIGAIATCWQGLPIGQPAMQISGKTVHSAFVMNLLWNNGEQDKVVKLIARHDPDFLILTEVSRYWTQTLSQLEAQYPHHYHCAEWRTVGGSVILSRMALKKENFCGPYASLGLATFEVDDTDVDFGVVHLRWPWPASGPKQITAITPKLEALNPDALIAGDFNSVTWSHSLQRFADAGGLTIVGGIGGTWGPGYKGAKRDYWFPAMLGLPIDNVMRKGKVRIVSAQRLERAGSDHLPLLVRFTVDK